MRSIIANLAPALGRQDHATSPSASCRSSHNKPRPSHPAFNVRDDRETPLSYERGIRRGNQRILTMQSRLFLRRHLDAHVRFESAVKFSVLAQAIFRLCGLLVSLCRDEIELICPSGNPFQTHSEGTASRAHERSTRREVPHPREAGGCVRIAICGDEKPDPGEAKPRCKAKCPGICVILRNPFCASSLLQRDWPVEFAPLLLPWLPSRREGAPCSCEWRWLPARYPPLLAPPVPRQAAAGWLARCFRERVQRIFW